MKPFSYISFQAFSSFVLYLDQPDISVPPWKPNTQLRAYELISKLYLDIETTGLNPVNDRVLLVGFRDECGQIAILDDPDEKTLLTKTWQFIRDRQPKLLVGHNLFKFDLPFLIERWRHYGIQHYFKEERKSKRVSASSFHGKPIEFTPIRLLGTNIVDTFHQICIWTNRQLS